MKMFVLSCAVLVAVAACLVRADSNERTDDVQWQSTRVNETVTAEAVLDILVKNYDANGDLHGTIKIALFGATVPMTVLNFYSICNGVKRPTGELKYAGSTCHRIIRDMKVQCGDTTVGDGTGGRSIYGEVFNDENFQIGNSEKGTVGMANRGPNSNGSQFYITFRSWQYLDNLNVVFGQIIDKESLSVLDKISEIDVEDQGITPKKTIKIVDCQAKDVKKFKIERRASVKKDKF